MKYKIELINNTEDSIKWLEIEYDDAETDGVFLYYCKSEADCYDTWHKSIDEAFLSAQEQYAVTKDDWEIVK